MDIVFLVDGSVRMGRRNYPIILDWIKLISRNMNLKYVQYTRTYVNDYSFSSTHSRIGLIQFSTTSQNEIELSSFKNRKSFEVEIDIAKVRFLNQGFNAYTGLKSSFDMIKMAAKNNNQVCNLPYARLRLSTIQLFGT